VVVINSTTLELEGTIYADGGNGNVVVYNCLIFAHICNSGFITSSEDASSGGSGGSIWLISTSVSLLFSHTTLLARGHY
jgi:hypothetical protein